MGILSGNRNSMDLAIDIGTVNTVIARKGWGIVLREKTCVAVSNTVTNEVVAIGSAAPEAAARTTGGVRIIQPIKRGVISDVSLTGIMLAGFIRKALGRRPSLRGLSAVICVPSGITPVEQAAVEDVAQRCGVRELRIVRKSLAAAIGADLPISNPEASMIVDIGGGTTDVAVISLGGVAAGRALRLGGGSINDAIIERIKHETGVAIGDKEAEILKLAVGLGDDMGERSVEVKGIKSDSGLPVTDVVKVKNISLAADTVVASIINAIKDTLAVTSPELAGDIIETGIVLTGGGALLRGLSERIHRATGIHVMTAENPEDCAIIGALKVLQKAAVLSTQRINANNYPPDDMMVDAVNY